MTEKKINLIPSQGGGPYRFKGRGQEGAQVEQKKSKGMERLRGSKGSVYEDTKKGSVNEPRKQLTQELL